MATNFQVYLGRTKNTYSASVNTSYTVPSNEVWYVYVAPTFSNGVESGEFGNYESLVRIGSEIIGRDSIFVLVPSPPQRQQGGGTIVAPGTIFTVVAAGEGLLQTTSIDVYFEKFRAFLY
ncbi:MAG: hypothetical protein AAGB31_15485 [Bdellovibrio sp.]